jgi:hypothetical protein
LIFYYYHVILHMLEARAHGATTEHYIAAQHNEIRIGFLQRRGMAGCVMVWHGSNKARYGH